MDPFLALNTAFSRSNPLREGPKRVSDFWGRILQEKSRHFGPKCHFLTPVFGPILGPKWVILATRGPESQTTAVSPGAQNTVFWAILGQKDTAVVWDTGPQVAKKGHFGPKIGQNRGFWPKYGPKWPILAYFGLFWPILDPILGHIWDPILGPFPTYLLAGYWVLARRGQKRGPKMDPKRGPK